MIRIFSKNYQNFSHLILGFRQSTQLRFVKAVSKQTTPNFGQVSTAECLASRAVCISQGCGKKSYILADINMLAKAQVCMQLCRQKRAFVGLAGVVWEVMQLRQHTNSSPGLCRQRRRLHQRGHSVEAALPTSPLQQEQLGKKAPLNNRGTSKI